MEHGTLRQSVYSTKLSCITSSMWMCIKKDLYSFLLYKIISAILEQRTEVVRLLRGWESKSLQKMWLFKYSTWLTDINCSSAHLVCCGLKFWRWTKAPEQRLSLNSPLCGDCFTTWTKQYDNDYESDCHSSHSIVSTCLSSIKQNSIHELLLLFAWEKLITRADQERCFNHNIQFNIFPWNSAFYVIFY